MDDATVDQFKAKYESLAGHVHLCADVAETANQVVALCREAGAGRVAIGDLDAELSAAIPPALERAGMEAYGSPFPGSEMPEGIDRAAVGVSTAAFGIAESGSIVEFATDDAVRLVSSLPRVHVGICRKAEVIPTLREAAPRIAGFFEDHPDHGAVTFISGPSRTADIEMRLTLGVHGPEVSHVIVLG